jgi:hypothetical protein
MPPVSLPPALTAPSPSAHSLREAFSTTRHWLFGDKGLSFRDLLDIVNPLQHIPGVSQLYRKLSGDEIKPSMELAGGALFGGPIGVAFSAAGLLFEAGIKKIGALGSPLTDSPAPALLAQQASGEAKPPTSPNSLSATLLAYRNLTRALAAAPGTSGRRDAKAVVAAYAQLETQRLRTSLHDTA